MACNSISKSLKYILFPLLFILTKTYILSFLELFIIMYVRVSTRFKPQPCFFCSNKNVKYISHSHLCIYICVYFCPLFSLPPSLCMFFFHCLYASLILSICFLTMYIIKMSFISHKLIMAAHKI